MIYLEELWEEFDSLIDIQYEQVYFFGNYYKASEVFEMIDPDYKELQFEHWVADNYQSIYNPITEEVEYVKFN